MVEADKIVRRTSSLAADDVAAVRAAVKQRMWLAHAVAHQDQRPAADPPRDEVAGLSDLRDMAGVKPAIVEDLTLFDFEDRWIGKRPPVDAEDAVYPVIDDQIFEG